MARNFDEELPDDLTFTIAGETFTMVMAPPSVLAHFEDAEDVTTAESAVARARERTTAFIQEGDRERWGKLLDADAVPYLSLDRLQKWMIEVQTGRPTEPPSSSAPARGSGGATSRGRSS